MTRNTCIASHNFSLKNVRLEIDEVNADQKCWESQGQETKSYHGFFLLVALTTNENSGKLDTLKNDQQYDFTTKEYL